MSAEILLSKLDKVKRTGAGRWMACCPAHADKGPSLSIREMDDGRILLHDFGAGCSAVEILAAIGLELRDLYPEPLAGHRKPERRPFPAVDVLRCVASEAFFAASACVTMAAGEAVDRDRLVLAASRIGAALRAAGIEP